MTSVSDHTTSRLPKDSTPAPKKETDSQMVSKETASPEVPKDPNTPSKDENATARDSTSSRPSQRSQTLPCCFTLKKYMLGPMSDLISLICRILLVIVNFFILIIATLIMSIGAMVLTRTGSFQTFLFRAEQSYQGIVGHYYEKETALRHIGSTADKVAFGLITIGIFIGTMALMGCCGGCLASRKTLRLFSRVFSVILLVEIISVSYIYETESIFKQEMLDSLEKYHGVDIHTVNSASRRWDRIMAYFECCGVNSYKDFRGLEYWPPTKIRGRTVILQTPIVCCKGPVNDLTCASKGRAHPRNNNMIKGCYNVIFNKFFYNRMTVGLIVLLIMFQSVVLFCCSWILCYMSRRNSY